MAGKFRADRDVDVAIGLLIDRSMFEQVKNAVPVIHPMALELEDAETIIAIAQLVVDIDGREGPEEIKEFFAIGKLLFELAGQADATIPTFATDEDEVERMFELATQIRSTPARELAFLVARALAAADLEVAPAEDTFLGRLRSILAIPDWRADELVMLLRSRAQPSMS